MTTHTPAGDASHVLDELRRTFDADGQLSASLVDGSPDELVVSAPDPRLDPWDEPGQPRIIEIVRIHYRDGQLHCPWLPGPIPASDAHTLPDIIKTVMGTRGY